MTGKFVFINLPTKDVAVAREFYTKVGFGIKKLSEAPQPEVKQLLVGN